MTTNGGDTIPRITTKRYNPDASRLICRNDHTTLYCKRHGEFYLQDQDGHITPIDLRAAREVAEKMNATKQIEEAIAYTSETKQQISAYLTISAKNELRTLSGYWHMTLSEVIERLIHYSYDIMQGQEEDLSSLPHIKIN